MAVYEVITPTGEAYEVEGPEGATKAQLVAAIQRTQPAEPQYKPRGIDYIQELPKGIVGGIAGILESAALGGATLLPEKYEAPVREKIQAVGDVAQSFVTPDTGLEQAIPRKFGEALGSFTGILGTSLIPGVGIPAAGALAVGAGAGEASERAREAGATQEERTKASLLGAGVGATEILPIGVAFNRAKSIFKALPEKKTKELTDRILDVGVATTVEGAQEAGAAILQNMIEQGYNPEQDTFEGAVEQGAYGAGVGGTVQTVLNFIDGRRNVAPKDDGSTDTTKEPDEPRSADGTQRVKDAVEGKIPFSFDDFKRGQVEQQQEGERFREDFVDPLKAETDDARIDTTRSGVSVPSDRQDAPEAAAAQVGSAEKVDALATAGLGGLDAPVDGADVGKGPEASALVYADLTIEQKRELAAAPENKKGELLDSFVKKPEPDTLSPEETVVAYVNDERTGRDTVVKKIEESPELSKRAVTGLPEGDTIPVYRFIAYDKKTKPEQEKLVSASLTPKGSAAFVKLATQRTSEVSKNRVGDFQRIIRYDVPRKDIKAYLPALSDSLEQKHNKKVKGLGIGKATPFSKKIENPVDYAKNLIKEQQEVLVDVSNLKGRVLKYGDTGKTVDFNLSASNITNKIRDEEIKTPEDFNKLGAAAFRLGVGFTRQQETKARQDLIDEVRSFYNLDQKKPAAPEVETPNMKQRLAAARTRMQAIGISKSITSSYKKDYDEATTIDAKTSILSEMENVSQQDLKKKRIAGERELKKAEKKETTARVEEDLKKEEAIERAETLDEAQKKFIVDRRKREAKISKEVDLEWRINFNKTASDKDKLIDEQYDVERTDDPVAIKDKRILFDLVTGKLKGVSTDKDMAAAKTYFSKVGNPANALDNIAFDIEHSDKNYRTPDDIEFIKNNYGEELLTTFAPDYDPATDKLSNEALINFQLAYDQHLKGTGEKFGLRAYAWMKKNLSKQTLDAFKKIKGKEIDEKKKISEQNSSDNGILRALGKKSNKKLKDNPYDLFYDLPTAQISTLAMKLHPRVRAILRTGDLRGALEEIGLNPTLPKEITDLAKKLGGLVGTTKVKVNEKIKEETAGRFNPKTNTIEINPASGMNTHVLLHEVYHAVTSATLANKSHPLTKQLNALYNEVKPYLGTAYGAQSLDEFVSESQSNTEFRQELASINIKGQLVTALQRLNNILVNFLRRLIGRDTVPLTALESASPLIESIMEPAPKTRNASILQMKTDQTGVKEVMANIGSTVKELSTVQGSIDQGKDFLLNGKITNGFKDFFLGLSDSIVAAKLANEIGFKDEDGSSLGMLVHKISTRTRGKLGESHDKSNELLRDITTFARKYPEQYAAMNDYTYNNKYGATLFGVYRAKGFESTYLRNDNKTSKIMTLGDEKIKLKDIYDDQQKSWEGMGKDGQELLERIRQHYQIEFRALKDILFNRVNDTLGEKSEEAKKLRNTLSKIFEDKSIAIYFPLVREGRYAVEYRLTSEASEGRINDHVFELLSTKAAADRRYEELQNNPDILEGSLKEVLDTSKKSLTDRFRTETSAGFVADVLTTVDKNPKAKSQTQADKDEVAALKEEIVSLYIDTLPETSFAKSFAGRKNVLGYIDDTTTAFKKKGFELPYSRIRLENSKLLLDVERKIREKAKILREEPVVKGDTFLERRLPEVTRMENELLARSEFNRKGATGPLARYENIARNLNQGAFIYTIGFNVSSAVVNLSQVPLFVLPYQAAKYGLSGSMGAVGRATKYISASRADISKYFDKDYNVIGDIPDAKKQEVGAYADMVKAAAENGMLQITSIAEFMGLQESGQRNLKTMRGKVDGVVAASAYAFNFAERMNRQVTLLSTYELVLRKKMSMQGTKNFSDVVNAAKNQPLKIQEAVEQAMIETQETNGGHAIETAPRLMQQGVGRVAGMYKSYGVKMYSTMLQSAIQAINTDLPSDIRKVAIKQLIGVHGSALFFAGIHGIPIYGAVELFSNLFLLDDEEDDFNTIVRKHVGEGWYKGPINQLAGTDVASRIRLTGLLIQQNRFNPDASLEENAFFYLGGPAYSTVKRVGRGLKDLSEGEVERGFESLMPAAVSNMYRTVFGRLAREGYKTRRGDPIYDDVTGGDLAFQFFGFAPVEYTFRQEQNNILKRIDTVTNRKRTKLLRKYYVSTRNGDYSETRKAIDAINKFNKRHPLAAITTDSVARSMRTHKKTSEKMAQYNGVSISPRMKAEIDANRNEWDSYDMA